MKDFVEKIISPLIVTGRYNDVVNTFCKLKTDEDRIIYTFNIMWEIGFTPDVVLRLKSAEESEKLRQEGNNVFARLGHNLDNTSCHKALSLYTQSIAFAPHTSRQLPLAYANRSAVLFELGLYSECIQDMDRALNLKYPDHLKGKLYLRKTKCLFLLGNCEAKNIIRETRYWINKMTQNPLKLKSRAALNVLCQKIEQKNIQENSVKLEKSESEPALPVIKSYNKEVPCASDAVAIKYDARNGRHVVATRDIDVGEVLVVEKPYSLLLAQENILEHCANCLKVCWATVHCKYCIYAMYCSEQCRNIEWNKRHDVECAAFPILMNHGFGDFDLFSLRLTVLGAKEAGDIQGLRTMLKKANKSNDSRTVGFSSDGKFHSNKYISLYNLKRNTMKRSFLDLFHRAVRACFILYVLAKHTMFFGAKIHGDLRVLATNENVTFLGGLILRNRQIIPINALDFYEVRNLEPVKRGLAITAFCSLFNHSCRPNIFIGSRSNHIVSYTMYPIKKGEQLLCAYGVHFFVTPKPLRQQHLLKRYHFSCSCVACEENWPTCNDDKSLQTLFVTTKAGDEKIVVKALAKFRPCYYLLKLSNVADNPYIIEDLLAIIRMLHGRVPIHSPMLNIVAEALKLVYEYDGNKFVLPSIQTRDV